MLVIYHIFEGKRWGNPTLESTIYIDILYILKINKIKEKENWYSNLPQQPPVTTSITITLWPKHPKFKVIKHNNHKQHFPNEGDKPTNNDSLPV